MALIPVLIFLAKHIFIIWVAQKYYELKFTNFGGSSNKKTTGFVTSTGKVVGGDSNEAEQGQQAVVKKAYPEEKDLKYKAQKYEHYPVLEKVTLKQLTYIYILRIGFVIFTTIGHIMIFPIYYLGVSFGFAKGVYNFAERIERLFIYYKQAKKKSGYIDLFFDQKLIKDKSINFVFLKRIIPIFFIHYIPLIFIFRIAISTFNIPYPSSFTEEELILAQLLHYGLIAFLLLKIQEINEHSYNWVTMYFAKDLFRLAHAEETSYLKGREKALAHRQRFKSIHEVND